MADTATLQARLDAAEEAYHQLMVGNSARVVVDQNGERIEFTAANAARLQAYIAKLQFQLDNSTQKGPLGITI